MTPSEFEFLQDSIRELKNDLTSVRSDVHRDSIIQGNALAAVAQKVSDLQDRLFLDSTSSIPRLTDMITKLDKRFTSEVEKENTICMADRKEIRDDVVSLKVRMAGVAALYSLIVSAIVSGAIWGLKILITGHS